MIDILNPLEQAGWDKMVREFPGAAIFHSAGWSRVLFESYGYTPQFVALKQNSRWTGILPVMEIRSFLTGKRGVSLPFSDVCPPLIRNPDHLQPLIAAAISYAGNRRWKFLELRSAGISPKPFCSYYGHQLGLSIGEERLFAALKNSHKRNIAKAAREGVEVRFSNSRSSIAFFYRLHCMTRKKHGRPPQPFLFFRKLHEHVISKGMGIVALASHRGSNVAGAVFLHFGNAAVYKYGASDSNALHLRPNNLVMWESIRWYTRKGMESLDFGRTDMDHDGLLRFKRGWGGKEATLHYHRFDPVTSSFMTAANSPMNSHQLMKNLPEPALRLIGRALYRHVG